MLGPNITGTTGYFAAVKQTAEFDDGALSINSRGTGNAANIGGGFPQHILYFDASKSNTIYSAGTIQPLSTYALMIIRA